MGVSSVEIVENFADLVQLEKGKASVVAEQACSPHQPKAQGLCFCPDEETVKKALDSQVAIIVTLPQWAQNVKQVRGDQALLSARNLQLAMAKINARFFPVLESLKPFAGHRLHPSAVIAPSAQVAETALVGPHAVTGEGVRLEDRVVIGPNTTVEAHATIGAGTHIHAQVFIGHHVRIGRGCEIQPQSAIGTDGYGFAQDERGQHFKKPHYGTVVIEDHVSIGCGVYIDRGTFEDAVIGEGTKIDNYCHFGHNVKIGRHTLITAGMITAGSATIGNHCVFGGRTTVAGHLEVCDQVQVAGHSVISNTVKKPGQYGGYPLIPLSQHLKVLATSAHLVEMRKGLQRVLKKLGLETDRRTENEAHS